MSDRELASLSSPPASPRAPTSPRLSPRSLDSPPQPSDKDATSPRGSTSANGTSPVLPPEVTTLSSQEPLFRSLPEITVTDVQQDGVVRPFASSPSSETPTNEGRSKSLTLSGGANFSPAAKSPRKTSYVELASLFALCNLVALHVLSQQHPTTNNQQLPYLTTLDYRSLQGRDRQLLLCLHDSLIQPTVLIPHFFLDTRPDVLIESMYGTAFQDPVNVPQRCIVHLNVLPPGLFSRLLARLLSYTDPQLFWKTGMITSLGSTEMALLEENPEAHTITFTCISQQHSVNRGLLSKHRPTSGKVKVDKSALQRVIQVELDNLINDWYSLECTTQCFSFTKFARPPAG